MLHMNRTKRYQSIYRDLCSVYNMRGLPTAHYFAGLAIGIEIGSGVSNIELERLTQLFGAALNAK